MCPLFLGHAMAARFADGGTIAAELWGNKSRHIAIKHVAKTSPHSHTPSRLRIAAPQPPYAGNSNNPRMKTMALATSTTIVYPTISLAFRRVIPSRASAQKGCNMLVHSSP